MPSIYRSRIPRDAAELDQATMYLEELERLIADCHAKHDPFINEIERMVKRHKKQRDRRLQVLGKARQRWLDAMGYSAKRYKKRLLGPKSKSLHLRDDYEIRWRDQPPVLVVANETLAVAWLKKNGHEDKVRVEETLKLKVLEANPELVEQVPGISFKPEPERAYLHTPSSKSGIRIL